MVIKNGLLASSLSMLLFACVTIQGKAPVSEGNEITGEMLLNDSPLDTGTNSDEFSSIELTELTDGMILFLSRNIDEDDHPNKKLRDLLYAVIGSGQFDLIYDDSTRTAEDTFREQRGNCLSFTNMFVAMARHIGLDADYQEVSVPPSWAVIGQSLLFSQHVNVLVSLDKDSQRIVDFNMADFDFDYDRKVISDTRARAHYFSNIGVDYMLKGETANAFVNFRESVAEDPTFGPAWVNLGILYRREEFPDYAEAAYLTALDVEQFNLVAMSNLSSLYEEQGDAERAAFYEEQVKYHRSQNPYYRYEQARLDFDSGNYDSAIRHLKFAIREQRKEDRFYSLLSSSYLMKGDTENARRWMEKAEEIAVEYSDKRKYNHKLEMLMGLDQDT